MKWKNKGHEFDNVGHLLEGKRHIYLYGAAGNASELIYIISDLKQRKLVDWEIHLVDKDKDKQLSGWEGYEVISPEQFFSEDRKDYFVVACPSTSASDEICQILYNNNIPSNLVFKGFYFLYTYLPVYFAYTHDMVFFTSQSILPSTVCNLNCRDCLNFTPYIKTHITDSLENMKKDVDVFFNAVDLIYRLQITGGEPLLYKYLVELLDYIDKNYRNKIIRFEMVTNGTVIPSDELCDFLRERKIYIFLDDYRMSLENGEDTYNKIYKKLEKYNINYCDNHVEQWIRLLRQDKQMQDDEKTLTDLFHVCDNPWSTLRLGKIAACNYAMYAAKAGVCEDSEDEYYDLNKFTPDKKKELMEFRVRFNERGFVNLCKRCAGWTTINENWCDPAIQVKGKLYE